MAIFIDLVPANEAFGLWCPQCLLPSGYAVDLFVLSTSGITALGTVRKCHDCGSPLPAGEGS